MDPFALLGIIAVTAALAYAAAAQKYGRKIRRMQQGVFSASIESTTKCVRAALQTLVEDFKVDEAEATKKLFARCAENGMVLKRIDPQTGESSLISQETTKS
jgi:hypothetical protein